MTRKLFRQGDVLFRQITSKEKKELFNDEELKDLSKRYKKFVVRLGESGNRHTLVAEQPFTILRGKYNDDELVVEIKNGVGTLKHAEHKALSIPRGTYQVLVEREFDYLEGWERNVRD